MERDIETIKKWNSSCQTRCRYCVHYKSKEDEDRGEKCQKDGWCDLPMEINGKKSKKPYHAVEQWDGRNCKNFTDRESGLTGFEVHTHVPERSRTPMEIEYLSKFITWRDDKYVWR